MPMSPLVAFLSVAAALSLQAKPAASAKASPEENAVKKLQKVALFSMLRVCDVFQSKYCRPRGLAPTVFYVCFC